MYINSRELFDIKGNLDGNKWYCAKVDDHARADNLLRYIASQWQMTRNSKLNNVYWQGIKSYEKSTGRLCYQPSPPHHRPHHLRYIFKGIFSYILKKETKYTVSRTILLIANEININALRVQ